MRVPIVVIVTLIFCVAGCKNKKEKAAPLPSAEATVIKGNFNAERNRFFDSSLVPAFLKKHAAFGHIGKEFNLFYRQRNFAFAWFDEDGMIEQAGNLYNHIKNIGEEGLNLQHLLYQQELNILMENVSALSSDSLSAEIDMMLTAQYLQYAKTVWQGIDENETLSQEWLLPRKSVSYLTILDSLISGKDVLANPPVYKQYYLLKEFLKEYRLAEPADSFVLSDAILKQTKGDSSAEILVLKNKLALLGEIAPVNINAVYDSTLSEALMRFQLRTGLSPTGKIGRSDIAAINIPIHERIETILVNMERCRWVPQDPPPNHIIVNIPDFRLHVVENNKLAWSMNVVVGKSQHKTVVFNGDIRYVVFSPYWNIPYSIMKNETLPALRHNPNYLKQHNMEWNGNTIRQRPGPNNSLGLVKFLFPNSHSIYLHDSPAKSLFNESSRAFSHGCIRVAEPKRLAEYLLRNDTAWTKDKIEAAMQAGKEKTVSLRETVPVFIAYFTAWVDQKGALNFRKDIYDRDKELLSMMLK